MLNTQHDDYTLDDQTFLQVSRMTTMETYNHLEDAGLIEKTETGETHINQPKENQ